MIMIFRTILLIGAIWCLVSALGCSAIGAWLLMAADNRDAADMARFVLYVAGVIAIIDVTLWCVWRWL